MNKCVFLGRFTKDVELKTITKDNKDTTVANFTLAVNRKFKKEGYPDADFLRFVAFGRTAEVLEQYCTKGSQIAVSSRVQTRSWEDTEGNKHYITEFVVEDFSFAGSSKNNSADSEPTSSEDEEFVL